MITLEEKEVWIRRYYPFCESYMKMALADRNKIPQLEIRLDKGSYTDHSIIHIGISELEENDKYPYGKPQTDEVARGSGNREYGCRRLREKLPNFSGVSFF